MRFPSILVVQVAFLRALNNLIDLAIGIAHKIRASAAKPWSLPELIAIEDACNAAVQHYGDRDERVRRGAECTLGLIPSFTCFLMSA